MNKSVIIAHDFLLNDINSCMAKSKKSEIDGLRPSRKKAKRGVYAQVEIKRNSTLESKLTYFPPLDFNENLHMSFWDIQL